MEAIDLAKQQLKKEFNIVPLRRGFQVHSQTKAPVELSFEIKLCKLIFPTREGELIKDIHKLPTNQAYSLSYPGTASTKTMILFTAPKEGIFIGGVPTYEFAKIKIQRLRRDRVLITYSSKDHGLFFIPFKKNWRGVVKYYQDLIGIEPDKRIRRGAKYFLQIGVRGPGHKCAIKHFSELNPVIDRFRSEIGPGHIIHLFGTNAGGCDSMFPDFSITPELGGKKAMTELVSYIKKRGLLTSHQYNPRIADENWVEQHPEYRSAIVKKGDGMLATELYKERYANYVMNPNNERWLKQCMRTIRYLKKIGFDYIQLDQFTYQRNFYNRRKPLQVGYKKLLDKMNKEDISCWLEGVSDIHKLKPGNFYQILTRDTVRFWKDHENRRGYPYGVSYPQFFTTLYPNMEISYQLVTEKNNLSNFERRLKTARKINAQIYELQMCIYGKKYLKLLDRVILKIKQHDR